MKIAVALLLVAAILPGCRDPNADVRTLQAAGYTEVQLQGYSLFGCSEDDFYRTRFTAKGPTGRPVSGVVCSGFLFKGSTIRLD